MLKRKLAIPAAMAALALAGCSADGLSTNEVVRAAEERVRQKYGLGPDAQLATEVFVGSPRDGDTVICGTVTGAGAGGTAIPPQRFVAATDPARWMKFEEADPAMRVPRPAKFIEWETNCMAERGDNTAEPLSAAETPSQEPPGE